MFDNAPGWVVHHSIAGRFVGSIQTLGEPDAGKIFVDAPGIRIRTENFDVSY
jgi:hypothetical protein